MVFWFATRLPGESGKGWGCVGACGGSPCMCGVRRGVPVVSFEPLSPVLCLVTVLPRRRVENEHVVNAFGRGQAETVPLHFEVEALAPPARTPKHVLIEALAFIVVVFGVSLVAALTS